MVRYLISVFAVSILMAGAWTYFTGERYRGPEQPENDDEVRERVELARQRLAHPETGYTNAPTRGPRRRAYRNDLGVGHLDRTRNITPDVRSGQ